MVADVEKLLQSYKDWMFTQIKTRTVADAVEITLPFLDRDSDYLQVYLLESEPGEYLLTDDGYTISNLELAGCSLDTEKRQELLLEVLNGFGVSLHENELSVSAHEHNFPQRLTNLVQAILAVDDLAYLASSNVSKIFLTEVTDWLSKRKVRYSPKVSLLGKNDIHYSFDILIPASPETKTPERIIESFGIFDLKQAEALAYRWGEVRKLRTNTKIYAVFSNKKISKKIQDICDAEDMNAIQFSDLESKGQELMA